MPSILYMYFNPRPRDRIQEMTFAGISRYAGARRWNAVAWSEARLEALSRFLAMHRPVAGCVIECSDDNSTLPPHLFGSIPTVYLHAAPSLYGGRVSRVNVDNESVARIAFKELSAGRPESYAVVGDYRNFTWSRSRIRMFRKLAVSAGCRCRVFAPVATTGDRAQRLVEWVSALKRKTAVFAVNDFTAAEVASAAEKAGMSMPGDFTLCGADNVIDVCEASAPGITSIQIDFEREGFEAASLLQLGTRSTELVGPLMPVWRGSTLGSKRGSPHILAAIERIRREACDGLSARDVIADSPGSKSLFNLRFREATGHSVHDEIEHVRMDMVFTLLSQTDTAVGAIAAMCGYRSNIALHKAFRLRTGMSMSEWRKHNRK